jgi:DNA-binding MarR family transcriptional regulator
MAGQIEIPSQCNCNKIRKASRHISRFYDACLGDSGLRATQFTILGYLKHRGPMTMLQLARLLAMDRATIGHNLRPLERDGLVTIEVSEKDRRARIVSVTKAGLARVEAARPGWDRAQAEFERLFGSRGVAELQRIMDRVADCEFGTRNN